LQGAGLEAAGGLEPGHAHQIRTVFGIRHWRACL
jgi:hypothetical protein